MKETTYVPVPREVFYELQRKASAYDMIGYVATNHPDHLVECVRKAFGITEEGKEKEIKKDD